MHQSCVAVVGISQMLPEWLLNGRPVSPMCVSTHLEKQILSIASLVLHRAFEQFEQLLHLVFLPVLSYIRRFTNSIVSLQNSVQWMEDLRSC